MRYPPQLFLFILLVFMFPASSCTRVGEAVYEKPSRKSLPDILEDAEFSISEHNLRIVERLHIGKSIRDNGNSGFPDYEIILYCSLTFAEKILTLNPKMINACPGRITVRGTRDSYIISAPLWPETNENAELNRLMHAMNREVMTIVDYAAADWTATDNN